MASAPPRPATLAAVAWVSACAAATLAGVALCLSPAEQARAWPLPLALPGATGAFGPLAVAAAAASLAAVLAVTGWIRARNQQGALGGLLVVYPLLLGGLWFVLGADGVRPAAWVVGAVLGGSLAFLLRRGPRHLPPAPAVPARRWLPLDLAMIGLPVAAGLGAGIPLDGRAILVSAVCYPVFALLQLTVFLVVPARRLRALGLGPGGTGLACALVFALLHWPHPAVFVLTLAGMAVWAAAWLRGRPLWQVALVMGWSATAASQFLPDAWTGHMTVGPRAVRAMAVRDLAAHPGPGPVAAAAWLTDTYPAAVGRPPAPGELARWQETIDAEQRARVAWEMLLSDEYARRAAAGDAPPPPPLAGHWTALPEPWPGRLAVFASAAYLEAAGGTREGFLAAVFADLLGRRPPADELAAWSWGLLPVQRTALARLLLAHRLALAATPYAAPSFPPVLLPSR